MEGLRVSAAPSLRLSLSWDAALELWGSGWAWPPWCCHPEGWMKTTAGCWGRSNALGEGRTGWCAAWPTPSTWRGRTHRVWPDSGAGSLCSPSSPGCPLYSPPPYASLPEHLQDLTLLRLWIWAGRSAGRWSWCCSGWFWCSAWRVRRTAGDAAPPWWSRSTCSRRRAGC